MEAEFAKRKATIYAISNEPAAKLKEMRAAQKLGPTFVFLSDPKAKLAGLYAGKYDQGYLKPATVVIDRKGKITFATSLDDYTKRPSAAELLRTIL